MVDMVVGLGIGYLLDDAIQAGDAHAPAGGGLEYAQRCQTQGRLLDAIARLPPRAQLIVRAHYFQHVPFSVLTQSLGVSKGRVSQLHHAALAALRQLLDER